MKVPICPACQASNPDGFRFCGRCGRTLALLRCTFCGAATTEGQGYCGQCGSELAKDGSDALSSSTGTAPGAESAAASRPANNVAERRLATVLFADVVGFTSLAERTDPELVARMVDAAFNELGDVVTQHGGTIDKYMGDSIMALFGVPVAHDDDAERAVAAAMAIRQLGGDLVFSIGINSGEVMATALGRGDVTVIGDTVNVAARLEKAAAPGEVLCGRLTAELASARVNFRERQPVLLKGKSEPVGVWEAVSLRRGDRQEQAEDLPLVGRNGEVAYVDALWQRAKQDRQTQLVVVCGEAGVGKTRLLNEIERRAASDATVARASYPGYGAMGGARLAAEIITQLGPAEDPDVEARVRSVAGEIDKSLQSIDPVGIRQEQLWAFGRLLKEKAKGRPLLLILDDMHRSDERTLDIVGELSNRLSDVPLFALLAGRTEPEHWLSRLPAATTVRLGALGRSETAELAASFAGDKPLVPEASEFLVDLSGGNALYLRELISMARAQRMLVDEGGCYRLKERAGIPATLQALLAARLDSLEPTHKLILQHASVLGEATPEQVSRLGSIDLPGAATVLESLVDSNFLRRGSDGRYQAPDSLLREVAYEMLPRNVRGELHRRAAQVVESPEDRARHLERATRYLGDDAEVANEAAEALVEAGQAFIETSRHLDAMRLLERAVALGFRRARVLIKLAELQALCGKQEDAFETLALVPDDPDDPTVAVERDHTAAAAKIFSDPAWSVPRLAEVATRWRALDNAKKEAWAHANAGVARFNLSQMDEAAAELEQALEMFEAVGDRPGAISSSSFLCLANPTDPRVPGWLEDALRFADETGDRTKQVTALATLAWKNFIRSMGGTYEEMEEAATYARRLAELSEELGANDMALHGWSLLALMARDAGMLDEAEEYVLALKRVSAEPVHYGSWLGWAASFCVTVARGATEAAPPFPPESSPDPVAAMAGLVIEAELTLAGRVEEAVMRVENAGPPVLEGPLAEVGGMFYAIALVLSGRSDDARPWIEKAAHAAGALDAKPAPRHRSRPRGRDNRGHDRPPSARVISREHQRCARRPGVREHRRPLCLRGAAPRC